MTTITPVTTHNFHSDTNQYSTPATETQTPSSLELKASDLNTLKVLLEMCTNDNANAVEKLQVILRQYGVDSSAADFEKSKVKAALERIRTVNDQLTIKMNEEDVEGTIAAKQRQTEVIDNALNDIQLELRSNSTKAKYAATRVPTAFAQVQKNKSENGVSDIDTGTSFAELWMVMVTAIANIRSNYVDFYADLMQKYTDMYDSFNKHVQHAASEAVSSGDDGNNVTFDKDKMEWGFDAFKDAIEEMDLGSVKDWDSMKPEEQTKMVATLQPAFKVDGNGKISFNLDQVSSVPIYPSGINDKGKVSTASYQAWLASFNASGSSLQSNMQAFAQRYSQVNSTFDNLNKVLSGIINSMGGCAENTLKSLG